MSLSYGFALNAQDTSEDFSEAFYGLIGEGVCEYGGMFNLTLLNNFDVSVAPGFALARGRYLKSDEPVKLTFDQANSTFDRYDAIAVHVDYVRRSVSLEILVDVGQIYESHDVSGIRDGNGYSIILYVVQIKRGSTSINKLNVFDTREDTTLCGIVLHADTVSNDILSQLRYVTVGIDEQIASVISQSDALMEDAERAIDEMDDLIVEKGQYKTGDVVFSAVYPTPTSCWLKCNGGSIPDRYNELIDIVGVNTPVVSTLAEKYAAYIYTGINFEDDGAVNYALCSFNVNENGDLLYDYSGADDDQPNFFVSDSNLYLSAAMSERVNLSIDQSDGCLYYDNEE